jgi:alkyl hydroperoxide reductase subunit F
MLNNELINALKTYTANMQHAVTLVLNTGEHAKRDELKQFLTQVVSVSDNLNIVEK